jgi:hypothetical protein
MTAAAVAMPSAQQLAAIAAAHGVAQPQTSVAGQTAQHDQVVSKVLVDALHGGDGHGPNIDALINGVSSQGSAHDALQAFASHAGSAVPFGHMGFAQAFGGPHLMLTSEALMVHQDAAPPAHG